MLYKEQDKKTVGIKQSCIRIVLFVLIVIIVFQVLQCIFVPKFYQYVKTYDSGKLSGLYAEADNSIDVVIAGTSHAAKAILPMELYESYGIKSYNLSTSLQPIEATYYMLAEALKTQKPKVFIYDVSNLYNTETEEATWRYVLDDMEFGKNKLELAKESARNITNAGDISRLDLLFPMLRYHSRWTELTDDDFTSIGADRRYFGKGGQISSVMSKSDISVEQMNDVVEELMADTKKKEHIYDNGEFLEQEQDSRLYNISVPEKNIEWLKKIYNLCKENGIELLAVKVPAVSLPQLYGGAWTIEKYQNTRAICNEYEISYYDLLYDADININWESDTSDEGKHLNLYGAQKVSSCIGRYLNENYELENSNDNMWDEELALYKRVRRIAMLQLEQDFNKYIDMLANDYNDMTVFMSVAGDMAEGLTEAEYNSLKKLGLQTDFSNIKNKAFAALIENGRVTYEASSNRQIIHTGILKKSGQDYELLSSGWKTIAKARVIIEDNQCCYNNDGLNIVVYDEDLGAVADSACFNGAEQNRILFRKNQTTADYETSFEEALIKASNSR